MRTFLSLLFTTLFIARCSFANSETATDNVAESETPEVEVEKEIVEFSNVDNAEKYLWDAVRNDRDFSHLEKILADEHFVTGKDFYMIQEDWYESEVFQWEDMGKSESAFISAIEVKSDKGFFVREYQSSYPPLKDEIRGYEAEFTSEEDTYKLVELTPIVYRQWVA